MKVKIFTTNIFYGDDSAEALNQFIAQHHILNIDKKFVEDGSGSCWTFCVTYIDKSKPFSAVMKMEKGESLPVCHFSFVMRVLLYAH